MRGKKPKEREQYVLYIGGFLVEVTKEVYLEWYQSRRREKYQTEKQKKHGVCSLGSNRAAFAGKAEYMGEQSGRSLYQKRKGRVAETGDSGFARRRTSFNFYVVL